MSVELTDTMAEALEVLGDCRRYLTEFGSVEPSQLVRRINSLLTTLNRQKDEQSYLWQLATVNASRVKAGEQPLTYSEFMAGGGE
jgi:hypothetical protein